MCHPDASFVVVRAEKQLCQTKSQKLRLNRAKAKGAAAEDLTTLAL